MKSNQPKSIRPKQHQQRPGVEKEMDPIPQTAPIAYPSEGKLAGKVALITGGDSGIGKAVALLFAKEGAAICIAYLSEVQEAKQTQKEVQAYGHQCVIFKGDLGKEKNCEKAVEFTIQKLGKLDILINNAGLHWEEASIQDITTQQLQKTMTNNFFSYFWMTKYALPYLKKGSTIINTASVTAYRGSEKLVDYAASKGAIVSFTRSLAANLIEQGIRVNGVAPGPIWTPLIASSFKPTKNAQFGSDTPMQRAGMPYELAPSYLFLASEDSSYISGQFIHPNGGEILNG